jgi:hypothetical protein
MSALARAILMSVIALPAAGARPVPPGPLEPLRFLAGCWQGTSGDGQLIEEHYTSPSSNLILGMTRYTRKGVATGFEFSTIAWEDSTIVLTPRPSGQQPVPFRLAELRESSAVWTNPAHDFPTLIAYRRVGGDTLVARIEGPGKGGATAAEEWRMTRARCEG